MVDGAPEPLSADQVRWICASNSFQDEADPVPEELQQRAMSALRFGIEAGEDFHLVAVGSNRVGMERYINWLLNDIISSLPPCCDWCYVMNFEDSYAPIAIRLPTGEGRGFHDGVAAAVEDLRADIPQAFKAETYQERRQSLIDQFGRDRDRAFSELEERARELGFTLIQSREGLVVAPVVDGEPINQQDFAKLPAEQREEMEKSRSELGADLERTMRRVREIDDEIRREMREFDREIALEVIQHRLGPLREQYEEFEKIQAYLNAMEADMAENLALFQQGGEQDGSSPEDAARRRMAAEEFFRRYQVNLLVDHAGDTTPVVLKEEHPIYGNLVGKIERRGVMGTLVTDFTMIKAGALLRANQGFLLIDARDILAHPLAWDALKHALERDQVRIEEIGTMTGMVATQSLEPEPIPLDIKVILLGEPEVVNALATVDPQFNQLFKIRSEFHSSANRDDEITQALASFLFALEHGERPKLDQSGVAKLLEHSARLAGDQRRLNVELEPLADIAREAMQVAAALGRDTTDSEAVRSAIEERRFRARYASDRLREMLVDRTIMVDTEGSVVGQINGLTVMSASGYGFGAPVRITGRTFAGRGGIVDIEREVELGGPLHSKGVFILYGYLGGVYGQDHPLSLSASLVFEQTYSPVEGDSASLGELCALLSSLSDLPVRQGLAVTGSVNQRGEVQAIGGLNEKIEGFFDLCNERGLSGDQGVVFPQANASNLMLREDIVEAVESGAFHLYAVASADEAIALFTGVPAGSKDDEDGNTVHARVRRTLEEFAEATRWQAEK